MGFKEFLIPQEKKFFVLFNQQAAKIQEGVLLLQELLKDFDDVPKKRGKIKEVEHEADRFVHTIFNELNSTFITPIDREDISALASKMDDIMDCVYAAVNRMYLYEIGEPTEPMRELSRCLAGMVDKIVCILSKFHDANHVSEIHSECVEINRLENVADEVLNSAMADLFKTKDVMRIIKLKEIYDYLEEANDRCEDCANIISNILMKNS